MTPARIVGDRKAPSAAQVKLARKNAQMTQAEAASLVHLSTPGRWSEYESGTNHMEGARFELFLLLTHQHPAFVIAPRTTGIAALRRRYARLRLNGCPLR